MSDTERHWFEDIADHLGEAYLRYSFTYGTAQEVSFLIDALSIGPGARLLDVGCGPGRHLRAFAAAGVEVVGVDISERFVELARRDAPPGTRVLRADARELPFDQEFDAVVSLCQGAFGLGRGPGTAETPLDPDEAVLAGIARSLRPGGRAAVSAFNAYFQVRYLEDGDEFDAALGVNLERSVVRDTDGHEATFEMWTTCFTPRELGLLAERVGLDPIAVFGVSPGDYGRRPPSVELPELLVLAEKSR